MKRTIINNTVSAGLFCGLCLLAEVGVGAERFGLLSLSQAENMALQNDPLIAKVEASQESLQEKSVAAYSWPDPKFKYGVMNLNSETYILAEEPMTQVVYGLSQRIPPAGSLDAMAEKFEEMANATALEIQDQKLKTLLNVRMAWMEVYYGHHAGKLISDSLNVFKQLEETTRYQYRAGRGNQQDVVRAQLEQSLLKDKKINIHMMWEKSLATLKKWVGNPNLMQDLDMAYPKLAIAPAANSLRNGLERHPWLLAGRGNVQAAQKGVEYAKAQRRPGWSVDLQYGQRDGNNRADLVSGMVMIDMPLFKSKRQDRLLQASQADRVVAQKMYDDRRRAFYEKLEIGLAVYKQADERLNLYETQLLPQAQQNAEAALKAYQSGVSEFGIMVRARLTELTSQLQHLRLVADKAKAQVELLYLAGGI
ncbi:MAG: TolC family protein [Gammaproteobacteria bacterium]|nr:TolC family protein [Gammaproteobacteria bacterium]MDH5802869.1 TolC family protein [Gammaproteobacteria bacterium]